MLLESIFIKKGERKRPELEVLSLPLRTETIQAAYIIMADRSRSTVEQVPQFE